MFRRPNFLLEYLAGIGTLLVLFYVGNDFVALVYLAVTLPLPLVWWYAMGGRLAQSFLSRVILRPSARNSPRLDYFLTGGLPDNPGLWSRSFQVLLLVFGTTSLAIREFGLIKSPIVFGYFLLLAIFIFVFVCPAFVVLWIYDDSGLRCYDFARSSVYVPGQSLVRLITAAGGIGSFVAFVFAAGGGTSGAAVLTFRSLVALVGQCLLSTTIFCHVIEPRIISKFRAGKVAGQLPIENVQVQA